MNDKNTPFYNNVTPESIINQAREMGIDGCADLDIVFPLIRNADSLLDLGSGYGRVLDYLLAHDFKGEIISVERGENLAAHIEKTFGDRVKFHKGDVRVFNPGKTVGAITLLWGGLTDFAFEEQQTMLSKAYSSLQPNGLFVTDVTTSVPTPPGRKVGDRMYEFDFGSGTFHMWLPTTEIVESMARNSGFSEFEAKPYKTTTGSGRILYLMRKSTN